MCKVYTYIKNVIVNMKQIVLREIQPYISNQCRKSVGSLYSVTNALDGCLQKQNLLPINIVFNFVIQWNLNYPDFCLLSQVFHEH